MAARTAIASRIHGHTGTEDVAAVTGEPVAVGTRETEPATLIWGAGDVAVEVEVNVEVDVAVDVEVFVGALVVEDVDVEVEVRVGASLVGTLVGALVVRLGTGVREGSVGRLIEREALGRFEPPPHDAARTRATARNAVEGGRILVAGLLHPLELRGQLVGARIDLRGDVAVHRLDVGGDLIGHVRRVDGDQAIPSLLKTSQR
jgi:hypothetical protein